MKRKFFSSDVFFRQLFSLLAGSRLAFPILVASVVGIGTGLLAVGFIRFIQLAREVFFGGGGQILGFLGPYFIVCIPAFGGLLVGPIVTYLAPEAKGHGVPEVLKAVAVQGGRIRPIVAVGKALASALAIGSGASVGREGPIVQVGSALGSATGQALKLNESRTKNLIACGAAAGISSVFNAPIAGVMFSLEVILRDFGARTLSTVVIASVASSIVSRIFLGESPAFVAPAYSLRSPLEIFLYLGLGVLSAFAALFFIFALHRTEESFEQWRFPDWLKPAVGGLALGFIALLVPRVLGSGLETIEEALHGGLSLRILLLLVVAKIIATSVSLGSGSSGGVFAPALFIGSVLGGSVGKIINQYIPFPVGPPGAYALVGMASVFAAAAHAPVTAILIVFEMTGDYRMILPIMVSVVVATSISQLLFRESIYTMKLKKRGIDIGSLEEVRVLGALQVRDAMKTDFEAVQNRMPAKELMEKVSADKDKSLFVVNHRGEFVGIIRSQDLQEVLLEQDLPILVADDIATPVPDHCFPDEPLSEVARLMMVHEIPELPVLDPSDAKRIVGVVRSEDIFRTYLQLSIKRSDLVGRLEEQRFRSSGTVSIRFSVTSRSPVAGKEIKDLSLPEGVVLTSVRRGKNVFVPKGNTVLKSKDRVSAVLIVEKESSFRKWLADHRLRSVYF